MQVDLKGKVALVTGASRGIGRSVALALGRAGADVAVLATSEDRAANVAAELTALGVRSLALGADVANFAAAQGAVEKTIAGLGRLDVLVNNAGITKDGLLLRMSEEDFDRVIAVNLKGCFNCCRAAARTLMKANGGRIVNITSIVGLMGNAGQANYAAAKAGIVGFTKSLAKEFGSRGLTVNAVAPGFITTDMTEGLPPAVKEASLKEIPLGRFGSPEDVAGAVVWLCSDFAGYVTGQVVVVDGGMAL